MKKKKKMHFLPLLIVGMCCSAPSCSLPRLQVIFIFFLNKSLTLHLQWCQAKNLTFLFLISGWCINALLFFYFILFEIFKNLLIHYKNNIKLVRLELNMLATALFQLQQHRLYRSCFIWSLFLFSYCFSSLYGCQHKGQCRDWESIHATPVDTQIITNCNHWLIFSILIVTHWVEGTLISVVLGEIWSSDSQLEL